MTQLDETASSAPDSTVDQAPRPGRKRDHTRDPEILNAALEVLTETGYDGMTIEMVAARAKAGKATLYRRWASKADLVIDAVACMKKSELENGVLPDTGTLRGDLLAMIKQHTIEDSARKLRIMAGLMSMLSRDPDLAQAVNAAIVEPRAAVNRALIQRAIARGEIRPHPDVETLAQLVPSMAAYRTLVLKQPIDRAFLVSLIDGVLLPALGVPQA